jgi:phenylalanyl-tRNA synthetase alpha chain
MQAKIDELVQQAENTIVDAESEQSLQDLKVAFLGKKGSVTGIMKGMRDVSPEDRPKLGAMVNVAKEKISQLISDKLVTVRQAELLKRLSAERIDVTLPGRSTYSGNKHPITLITEEVTEIFSSLGFGVEEGPEIEKDFYNFEALNMPKDHPARDMQDTFYVSDDVVLRTHTSPVQIRTMLKGNPPVRVIAPGTVYRRDSDITHSPMFHQIEGFMVDYNVTFGDLKGILTTFIDQLFGKGTSVRFRPSFFPFTEPSAEVDIACVICSGKGCRVCGRTGWLEILGCGMIDPEVFKSVNYDPDTYSGFAFGMGIERIAMLKYGVNDLRLFFENDTRFLAQFKG